MKTNRIVIACLMLISGSSMTFAGETVEMESNRQTQDKKAKDEFIIDEHTAIVMTDPQNDFLSEKGKGWGLFGENITRNGTVEHLRQIFDIAAKKNMLVFISPHYYYKHDHQWLFEGPVEKMMHENGMFERKGQLTGEDFEGSGADWLDIYKPYINDGKNVIVTAPHKLFGPENNDLILQLRKRGVNKVIICACPAIYALNLTYVSYKKEVLRQQ